ncbi:PVC-type heme-binding CxxCH protein [Dyadobacter tibetensis]|uniref:PVC-type heme-binding CxxCH protein n=1 Tax=Dyadobacter tibetensis TaxID=1211851 RepID=UPI00046EA5A4|nr:PVC-type heme-binding CxxCH protein [Dyadobacter tibetensis]
MKYRRYYLFCAILFLSYGCTPSKYADALSPEASLKSMDLNPDFKIEIFAAEPTIMDPIELVFDEFGRAFVMEMPSFNSQSEPTSQKGRIHVLTDSDGDGRMDKSVIFAQNLIRATSILPWRGGLLLAEAGDIWYLKDENGDLKSDTKEKMFEGGGEIHQSAQITSLRYGMDNWVYAANNGELSEITAVYGRNKKTVKLQGSDFRFRMDRDLLEAENGTSECGQTFDEWGNRFITDHNIRIQQLVLPYRYAYRNDFLPSKRGSEDITNGDHSMFQVTPAPYWLAERTRRRNAQYQEQGLDRVEYAEDYFSKASGGTVYTGHTFPKAYRGNYFVGDISGNLIHRDLLVTDSLSPAFKAIRQVRKETSKEFLSSSDPWFRPGNFTVGPDGALYVIDYYRQHIEDPDMVPEDLRKGMDFSEGDNRGRIYRISPKQAIHPDTVGEIPGKMTSPELVALLSHPNQWQRLQAQRLLLERKDQGVGKALFELIHMGRNAFGRMHALYVLEGLGLLKQSELVVALEDLHPGVRLNAIKLAETFPALAQHIAPMVHDSSLQVALQATLSLGRTDDPWVMPFMRAVIGHYGHNRWFRAAVLSGKAGESTRLLDSLKQHSNYFDSTTADRIKFVEDFAFIQGAKNSDRDIVAMINCLADSSLNYHQSWTGSVISGLLHGRKYQSDKQRLGPLTKEKLGQLALKSDDPSGKMLDALLK